MVSGILSWLAILIIKIISSLGYFGIAFLMVLASCHIPVSSEIILAFSGYLAFAGQFDLKLVILFASFGELLGALIAYYIGFYGGRPLINKFGKYILISGHDLDRIENWFLKYGSKAVFLCRFLPLIRAYSSFPAGLAKMNVKKFILHTFCGSLLWSGILSYIGFKMGENWQNINLYFRKFDIIIGALILIGIIWFIKKHLK